MADAITGGAATTIENELKVDEKTLLGQWRKKAYNQNAEKESLRQFWNEYFQIEKSISELGDKVTDADKAPVNEAIETLKKSIESGNTEQIKADTEALQKAFYPIAEKIYKEQAANQGASGGPTDDGDGNVYDTDFEDKT